MDLCRDLHGSNALLDCVLCYVLFRLSTDKIWWRIKLRERNLLATNGMCVVRSTWRDIPAPQAKCPVSPDKSTTFCSPFVQFLTERATLSPEVWRWTDVLLVRIHKPWPFWPFNVHKIEELYICKFQKLWDLKGVKLNWNCHLLEFTCHSG